MRKYLLATTLLTAVIGAFEALLFSFLGSIVDWLSKVQPAQLWAQEGPHLLLLAAVLAGSILLVALQSMVKQQTLFGNFPMLLRWNFHRMMLGQSMSFYQDEFAGRIATKVMQTSLAVRDTWLIVAELLVFVVIYFVTLLAVLGNFDARLLVPFLAWVALYSVSLYYFVPRLGRVARMQADARSLMTGRITDAYANIATVKLFSHARRESSFARAAMQEFLGTVHTQMRLVTGFEIVNHMLSMGLIAASAGATLWLWTKGEASVGAAPAATGPMAVAWNHLQVSLIDRLGLDVGEHGGQGGGDRHGHPPVDAVALQSKPRVDRRRGATRRDRRGLRRRHGRESGHAAREGPVVSGNRGRLPPHLRAARVASTRPDR